MTRTPIIAALALALAAATAAAQPAPHPKKTPTPKELDAARTHFRDAEAAKARGDFQTAAVEYLAAYELFEEPEFFFDVAEVYRLAGDEQQALVYYERYLELDPQGRGAPQARATAESLRRSIAAKQDADHKAAIEAQRKTQEAADAQKKPDAQGTKPPDAQHPTDGLLKPSDDDEGEPTAAAHPNNDGRGLRIAGLASAGAGVAALGVGIAFGLRAHSISNEASRWTTFDPQRYDEGKAAQRNMLVLTAVGSAAVIAGGVLYYFGYSASEHGSVVLVPATDGSSFALTAEGHF